MPLYRCIVNGRTASIHSWDPAQPLLYALRGSLALRGAKVGCGLGQCGVCTVLVDRAAVRACVTPVSAVAGRSITTVEGLGAGGRPDPAE